MTIGEKLKAIRKHRKITQKELGIAIGLHEVSDRSNEKTAETRIAQYENKLKIPRNDVIEKLSNALNVNSLNFTGGEPGSLEYIMQTLFWLEESSPGLVKLFRLERISWRDPLHSSTDDRQVQYQYHESDLWPATPPMGMYFDNATLNGFLEEWFLRQDEKWQGAITEQEYFEWKINWPQTCDDCGKFESKVRWRAANVDGAV